MAMKRLHVMGGFGAVSSSGCDFSTSEGPDGSLLSEELLLSSATAEVGSGLFDIGDEASGSCSSMANLGKKLWQGWNYVEKDERNEEVRGLYMAAYCGNIPSHGVPAQSH